MQKTGLSSPTSTTAQRSALLHLGALLMHGGVIAHLLPHLVLDSIPPCYCIVTCQYE